MSMRDDVLKKAAKRTRSTGWLARLTTMSTPPERSSSEKSDDDVRALVQTLDVDDRRDEPPRVSMLKLTRKAQLSAYFTIAAAACGLIRCVLFLNVWVAITYCCPVMDVCSFVRTSEISY